MVRREQAFGPVPSFVRGASSMGAATVLPLVADEVDEVDEGVALRRTRRELEARRADAARARARVRAPKATPLFAGEGHLRLVPRFELAGEALVANDDLAALRRSRSAAPGRPA